MVGEGDPAGVGATVTTGGVCVGTAVVGSGVGVGGSVGGSVAGIVGEVTTAGAFVPVA